MIRAVRFSIASLVLVAATAGSVCAQTYANVYTPPKLLREGKTTKPIVGKGEVVIQVEVWPDGSHKVVKIIRSTNHGDDAAALEIAASSAYAPARRGGKPIVAFYDFAFRFTGASPKGQAAQATSAGSPLAVADAEIRAGNYDEAKDRLNQYLLAHPGTPRALELLATAEFFQKEYIDSAAAFAKVLTIDKQFRDVAAHAFALAAVSQAQSDPDTAIAYAKRALAIEPDANAYYALGTAESAAHQYDAAVRDLSTARKEAFADPKTAVSAKVNLDASLMAAQLGAGDTAAAEQTAAEIRSLDPSSTVPGRVLGEHYLELGVAAAKAQNHDEALHDFEQAAAQGDPQVTAIAETSAAFQVASEQNPDYEKMKAYADKALAASPNDPQAEYAEGIALAGLWATKHDASLKEQALHYLADAQAHAKAQGNVALALQIETFVKNTFKQ